MMPSRSLRFVLAAIASMPAVFGYAQTATVPLEDLGNTLAIRATVAGVEGLLLLDTGSYELRLRRSFASKLPLKLRLAGKDTIGTTSLKVGDVVDDATPVLVEEGALPFEADPTKEKVVGIVGLSFLQRHAVGLDLVSHRMALWRGGKVTERQVLEWFGSAKHEALPLKGSEGGAAWYRLRAEIDGKGLDLVVDTGTSWTTIEPRHAKQMRLRKVGSVGSYTFAGRMSVDACLASTMRFGSVTLANQIVAIDSSDEEYDGLLGLQSLRNCRVILDFPGQKASIGRVDSFVQRKSESLLASVGVDLMRLTDDRLMAIVGAGSPAERAGLESGDVLLSFNGRPAEELLDFMDRPDKPAPTAAWAEALLRKTYAFVVRKPDGSTKRLTLTRA